jgi:hypothetical protein
VRFATACGEEHRSQEADAQINDASRQWDDDRVARQQRIAGTFEEVPSATGQEIREPRRHHRPGEPHNRQLLPLGYAREGANAATTWPASPNPPLKVPPHDRHHYAQWLQKQISGEHSQFDTKKTLPFYLYLALARASKNLIGARQ